MGETIGKNGRSKLELFFLLILSIQRFFIIK